MRTAIDLAIDRSALVTSLAGGKATRSFFPDYSPYYEGKSPRLYCLSTACGSCGGMRRVATIRVEARTGIRMPMHVLYLAAPCVMSLSPRQLQHPAAPDYLRPIGKSNTQGNT